MAFLCFPLILMAQHRSVDCLKPEWRTVLMKARQEHKPIFVDCGATWCGPCKQFKEKVLGNDTVADFFNTHFISVYVDVDKDKLPEMSFVPPLSKVPTLFFIDAEKGEVVHANVGAPGVASFMAMGQLVLEGTNTVNAMRSRFQAGTMRPEERLSFLKALEAGGYSDEYEKLLPQYMETLVLDSLKSEEIWAFCEKEMNDPWMPIFQKAWENRSLLYEWHGQERVMDKFAGVFNWHLNKALHWKALPDTFNQAAFSELTSFLSAQDLPEREYYHWAIELEEAARQGDFSLLWSRLQKIDKSSMSETRKRLLIRNFVNKLVYNTPQEDWKPYIEFVDKMAKRLKDVGVKSELYYFERELWRKMGDEKRAEKAYRLGVLTVNPHFYDRQ